MEAASCGLPIVTTGAGGIPSMIKHRESGIVVGLNDDKALAAGVIEIIEHPRFGRNLARQKPVPGRNSFRGRKFCRGYWHIMQSPSGIIEPSIPEAEAFDSSKA